MFQSTRRRLALSYTLVTAILLLLFAMGTYGYVRYTLVERIDDTLKHVIEVIERSLVIESAQGQYAVNVEASFRRNDREVEDDHIDFEWFDAQGESNWSTFTEALAIPLNPNRRAETVSIGSIGVEHSLRQVTERVERDRHILGYLRVSHPWFEVTRPIRQLIWDLILGTGIMSLCVAAMGWWLSGIAMEPVKESYQSLKQFTADASHELRNPIATIQTNVQMALSYPEADPQWHRDQLRVVERLTQRLGNLVNDLLFLARSDGGMLKSQNQAVSLDALLLAVVEEQRLRAEQNGIHLSLDISESLNQLTDEKEDKFRVWGDWDELARLFTNLLSNAINYAYGEDAIACPQAKVVLSLRPIERDRLSYLQVDVQDWGVGIPPDAIPLLFDRFYRVDSARSHRTVRDGGTGLGLAIAQAIVNHHQGFLSVESVPLQGSCFKVVLPLMIGLGGRII
jgi:OmpR-family two-component system manganese-sensing sensor histidine kinase